MGIMDEINDVLKFPSKKDKEEAPKYIMIRFGVPADGCAVTLVNPDIQTTKTVLDSLEKIPILDIGEDDVNYKPIGIFYEAVGKQKKEEYKEMVITR